MGWEAGVKVSPLRVILTLQEDWSLLPTSSVGQLTATCVSSSRESNTFFFLVFMGTCTCVHTHTKKSVEKSTVVCKGLLIGYFRHLREQILLSNHLWEERFILAPSFRCFSLVYGCLAIFSCAEHPDIRSMWHRRASHFKAGDRNRETD